MGKVIYADFRKNVENPKDPCSECNPVIKKSCCTTCEKARIYWENLANRLKGHDV